MATILVVEDDAQVQAVVRVTLRSAGHEVVEAFSGDNAIEIASGRRIDLAILDNRLPGISGLDCLRQLRALHRLLPAIVITGYASMPNAIEAIRVGVADYMPKPFTPRELLESVQRALRIGRDCRLTTTPAEAAREPVSAAARPTASRTWMGRRRMLVHLPTRGRGSPAPARRTEPHGARRGTRRAPIEAGHLPQTVRSGAVIIQDLESAPFQSTNWTMTPLGSRTWKARSPHSSTVRGIVTATPSASRSFVIRFRTPPAAWGSHSIARRQPVSTTEEVRRRGTRQEHRRPTSHGAGAGT